MLLPAITFDAAMPAGAALARLARHGVWEDPRHPEAAAWIEEYARRVDVSFEDAVRRLARDPQTFGAAVRRQWNANVLWYARPVREVLVRCLAASPGATLLSALGLHESDSDPAVETPEDDDAAVPHGVVLEGGVPRAVSPGPTVGGQRAARPMPRPADTGALRGFGPPPHPVPRMDDLEDAEPAADPGLESTASFDFDADDGDDFDADGFDGDVQFADDPPPEAKPAAAPPGAGTATRSKEAPPPPAAKTVSTWPRVDAPDYVPARQPFDVVVGFAAAKQAHVIGGQVVLPVPAAGNEIDVDVVLVADGLDAPAGWTRTMRVDVRNPAASAATFALVGRDPPGPEPVVLTLLEVRYVVAGTVCGTATRPLVVGQAHVATPAGSPGLGTPWASQPPTASAVDLRLPPVGVDLTIEIAKPDLNFATGRYVCRLYSPHAIAANPGPHDVDLGEDAKTFAKTLVEEVRAAASDPIIENVLAAVGDLVADRLPGAVFEALQEVAARVAPARPSVLVVSAEPYVPWELAAIDPPLDAASPAFLGAQTVLGRWLRVAPKASAAPSGGAGRAVRPPPPHPPATIDVRHMAVMAGMYKADSGMRRLPMAEDEAKTLATTYQAIPLAASLQALKQLLDAKLEHGFEQVGGAGAVHFAGHGDFDPARPDSSTLFLSDGRPLSSLVFRSAHYGRDGLPQPLLFLNACMIGIGGEILGAAGGFPGACLEGGFGGMLGALWEVDDTVARAVALEFWRRALPTDGSQPERVGEILRDLRANFVAAGAAAPVATYLSYVYYGHPCLTLQRTP